MIDASLATIRSAFFGRWCACFPEDAATLGVQARAAELRDPSEAGDHAMATAMRETLAALPAIATLEGDARLDAATIERHARFTLHAVEDLRLGETSFEPSILAHAALAFGVFQAKSELDATAIEARLAAIPTYLATRAARLAAASSRGHRFDAESAASFARDLLPGAAAFTREIPRTLGARGVALSPRFEDRAREAARAWGEHARSLENLLSHAGEAYAIGKDEYELRVASFFGAPLDLDELVREAREDLRVAQEAIVSRARRLAERDGGSVRDLRDAAVIFGRLWKRTLPSGASPFELYTKATERIVAALSERDLVDVPEGCILHMEPLPAGIAHGAASTNWPAPLCDPKGRALLLVAPDPAAHSVPATMNLAVHEGIPGHFLQSFTWQRRFAAGARGEAGRDEAPVRFLLVTDDVAMAHQDFSAMPNIEGWAVRMEELCLDAEIYDDEEAMLAVVSKAIRALRVIGDIGLHSGALSKDDVAALMCREAAMPETWGRAQAARYARIPVQAITYAVGARQIAELESRARAAWGARFSRRAFHRWLLAFGPVAPARLADALA